MWTFSAIFLCDSKLNIFVCRRETQDTLSPFFRPNNKSINRYCSRAHPDSIITSVKHNSHNSFVQLNHQKSGEQTQAAEAPNPAGELVRVHSYLMRSVLSTSLSVQLTRLHLATAKNQSAPTSTPPIMTQDGWMDRWTLSIMCGLES